MSLAQLLVTNTVQEQAPLRVESLWFDLQEINRTARQWSHECWFVRGLPLAFVWSNVGSYFSGLVMSYTRPIIGLQKPSFGGMTIVSVAMSIKPRLVPSEVCPWDRDIGIESRCRTWSKEQRTYSLPPSLLHRSCNRFLYIIVIVDVGRTLNDTARLRALQPFAHSARRSRSRKGVDISGFIPSVGSVSTDHQGKLTRHGRHLRIAMLRPIQWLLLNREWCSCAGTRDSLWKHTAGFLNDPSLSKKSLIAASRS